MYTYIPRYQSKTIGSRSLIEFQLPIELLGIAAIVVSFIGIIDSDFVYELRPSGMYSDCDSATIF